MSELKARGHGLERYADVMREWLNGTKVRDQFGGWNPTIMSPYVRRKCKLGEDVPREARAAPRGKSTSAVWVRQLQKDSADVKNGRQDFQVAGNAFQVKGAFANAAISATPLSVDDLKKIDIYSQTEDGGWVKEEKMAASLRHDTNVATAFTDAFLALRALLDFQD
ncbi:hypothetical protein AK812_SmicGene18908 [Symbiodinium microadriaticum]|uniref:Uncharacterized protein n=1 Tax=Symbiodinium microadriaticum TaxID=2951 RepID=A0A1Q9DTY1_SYMMI|nr:hypothetical protein AK812_SmicGene18908 [Symbiodinium microadriaticum]